MCCDHNKKIDEILRESRKSCPGPDKICYKLLRELPRNVKALACLLISSSINSSFSLVNWKEMQIKMIPKQNKDCSKAEKYRPISLTNCLAKVCETVVKNIVSERIQETSLYHRQPYQTHSTR